MGTRLGKAKFSIAMRLTAKTRRSQSHNSRHFMSQCQSVRIVSLGSLPEWVVKRLESRGEVIVILDADPERFFGALGPEVEVLIPRGALAIDREILDCLPRLRVIARTGVGYDNIDIDEATKRGIPVLYTPGAMSQSVAEHTLALILALLKNLDSWQSALRQGNWEERYWSLGSELAGKSIGIVGYGRVGRRFRDLLRPFDCPVLVCDPYLDPAEFRDHDIGFQPLEELLSQSDVVSLHVPLTQETTAMINADNLRLFQPDALLINTARGRVIDNLDILLEALNDSRLGGVGLDVFNPEPPPFHPLFDHFRVVATPHVASRTKEAQRAILETMLEDLEALLDGTRPRAENVVNSPLRR